MSDFQTGQRDDDALTGAQLRSAIFESDVVSKIKRFLASNRANSQDWIMPLIAAKHEFPGMKGWDETWDAFEAAERARMDSLREKAKAAHAALDEEMARLIPTVTAAVSRIHALTKRLDDVKAQIARGKSDGARIAKRSELAALGVNGSELDRIAPAFDPAPLMYEAGTLAKEIGILDLFLRTHNDDYLPDDFLARADEFISTNGAPHDFHK